MLICEKVELREDQGPSSGASLVLALPPYSHLSTASDSCHLRNTAEEARKAFTAATISSMTPAVRILELREGAGGGKGDQGWAHPPLGLTFRTKFLT